MKKFNTRLIATLVALVVLLALAAIRVRNAAESMLDGDTDPFAVWIDAPAEEPSPEARAIYARIWANAQRLTLRQGAPADQPRLSSTGIGRVQAAQEMILAASRPAHIDPGTWRRLQEAVRGIGTQTPIYAPFEGELHVGGMVAAYDDGGYLIVWPIAERSSVAFLTSVLVHEMRHRLTVEDEAGEIPRTLLRLIEEVCLDADFNLELVEEALSYIDQEAWELEHPLAPGDYRNEPRMREFLATLRRGLQGDATARAAAREELIFYAQSRATGTRGTGIRPRLCGPIIQQQGENAGRFFLPIDLARERLLPFLAH